MYIVIQIGGEGSRLKRILKNNPKCFLNILNKKIIDYQIEKLLQIKFNKIIILNNIKFSFVESYLKKKYGDIFIFFNETKPLGTGGSLSFLKNITTKNFLMLYGDIIFNVDLKKLFYFHLRKKSDLTIISHPNSHPYDSDIIDVDKNNKIVNFYKKPHKSNLFLGNLCLSGIFVFNKKILNQIKNFQYQDFSKDVIPLLIKNKFKLYSYRTREYMKDAGKVCRIKQIEADIKIKKFYRGNINKKMPAFFLDKDGVLNEEKYNRSYQNIKKVVFGSTKAVKIINDNNYLAVVVTNQPAIAKGFIKENDFIYLSPYLKLL
jgi:NDP-sugar pyrophosphorylase family protein